MLAKCVRNSERVMQQAINNENNTNSNFSPNSYAIEENRYQDNDKVENESKKLAFININQSYHIND